MNDVMTPIAPPKIDATLGSTSLQPPTQQSQVWEHIHPTKMLNHTHVQEDMILK